jgi:quinohemoprotein ethanol dehydrogenase
MTAHRGFLSIVGLALALPATVLAAAGAAAVDSSRLTNADSDPGQWMSYGRTWNEQRFSPLTHINDGNAARLGLAWYAELGTYRGIEATPEEVDGVLYNISAWNIVTAYEAASGKVLWTYDPKVAPEWARYACCGPSSRGLALWNGKVYVGALDGRLIALDARNGNPLWSVQTFDRSWPYSITGAPRVFDGQVLIGNGGADYGVRGFVSSYDAETGKLRWTFYLVPGDPAKGPDGAASDSVMPMATRTWTGEWWKYGGGGTAWDSFAYDPRLKLIYIGTGNGGPHAQRFRSPGGGDNLFLCSIIAVDAESGHYAWHYQMVPREEWDFTCTQSMILADLKIKGRTRQVIMQAPKDGFFYVLDRKTGELLSARNFVPNNWASHVDLKTGRPAINPASFLGLKPHLMTPTWMAAHSWNPMSFSPITGLAYFPAQEQWTVVSRVRDEDFKFVPFRSNTGYSYSSYPELRKKLQAQADSREKGYLLAWDPARQREAFRIPYPYPGSGGVLTTAGNLLVQGTIEKTLAVYRADNGKKLWEAPVESVPIAGPITYAVGDQQYIAVNVGWGGAPVYGLSHGKEPFRVSPARLVVFKLDATGVTLPPTPPPPPIPPPPPLRAPESQVKQGAVIYNNTCASCHGVNARGGVKDLRHMTPDAHAAFGDIVLGGTRKSAGMASFKDILTLEDVNAVHAYLIARAQEDYNDDVHAGTAPAPQAH